MFLAMEGEMAIAYSAAPRFEMGRVVKRTFSVVGSNLVTFALLSLVPALCLAVVSSMGAQFEDSAGQPTLPDSNTLAMIGGVGLVYIASAVVLQAAVVHAAVVSLGGRRASLTDCLATGFRNLVPLFLIGICMVLGIMAGMILLVIPGLILALMWSVVAPACVVERTGVFGSFGRSRELTRGHKWAIFGAYLLFIIVVIVISIPFGVVTAIAALASGAPDPTQPSTLATVAYVLNSMITGIIGSTFIASIYYELRQIKEGIGPEALASVFD
jgi:hypothetical protein